VTNEAFARIKIDQLLKDTDWRLTDGISVRYEYPLDDGGRADYALFDRQGRALAVLEAKSTSVSLSAGEAQGRRYADLLDVPFIFLSNGEEIWFCDKGQDAHFRKIETVFSQDDLARRKAARDIRRNPLDIPIDSRIAGGGGRLHQSACIETVCREIVNGRRKMLVEMATGTGKTRTAAALLKRLFEANWATRALFVVDRNTLAIQAEDAFAEHFPHLPCYRVPRTGRRFQDEKRVTIVTLQTLVNEYEKYSSGYFDLIVIDECHRSIYGQWRRALDHFDGIKVGLTATPCVMQDAPDVDDEDRAAIRDTLRFFEVNRPTYSYSMSEAIADGHLVPYEIYRAMTARTAATDGFSVARSDIDWAALDAPTRAELERLFADHDPLIVDPSALERKFTIPERNRAMVREFREVLENGYTGPNGVRRAPDWGKTIVFAVTKRHAETLARMFDDVFADKKPSPTTRYADFVVSGSRTQLGPVERVADGNPRLRRLSRAAVNGDRRTSDVGTQICRQKFDDAGAILGCAEAAQSHRLKQMVAHRLEKRRDAAGSNESRRDRIRGNSVGSDLSREILRIHDDGRFRGAIVSVAARQVWSASSDARERDDPAGALGLHGNCRRPAGIDRAVQVSLHDCIQVGIADQCSGRLGKRAHPATGVADSHIEPPPTVDDLLDRAVHRRGIGDVDFKSHRFTAASLDLGDGRVLFHRLLLRGKVRVRLEADIQYGHARAQCCEPVRKGAPESAARTRYERNLSLELRFPG
jgi:superfamily II DNA or RNA helicase